MKVSFTLNYWEPGHQGSGIVHLSFHKHVPALIFKYYSGISVERVLKVLNEQQLDNLREIDIVPFKTLSNWVYVPELPE